MTFKKIIPFVCIAALTFSNVTAQNQGSSKKYRLLTYGLPDFARQNALGVVESKWNIEFYGVAGCVIDDELEDSVKQENDKIYRLIEAEYGKGWENKFYEEVEEEYKVETQIDSLVKTQTFIKDKDIVNPLPGSPFPMYPIDGNGIYIVNVSTYNRQWEEQKLYRLKVNYKKSLVEIMNDYTLDK